MNPLSKIKQAFSQLHPLPDLLSLTAEEKYAWLMKKRPDLISNISVKHLSSYQGIHPESLSRIRKLYVRS